jgi:hypothetical protein
VYSAKRWLAIAAFLAVSLQGAKKTFLYPPIDLNTASRKDLEALPGIGAGTAKRIVAGRPYGSVKDLARIGVSRKTITTITPMVTAGPGGSPSNPSAPPPAPGMVWVNLDTKRYHANDSRWYGATKNGKYMTEADARREGYRPAKE